MGKDNVVLYVCVYVYVARTCDNAVNVLNASNNYLIVSRKAPNMHDRRM